MFERQFDQLAEMLPPGWTTCDGPWGTPAATNGVVAVSLDQSVAAVSFIDRWPEGFRPTYPGDPFTCVRVQFRPGEACLNIYGLARDPSLYPDLWEAAHTADVLRVVEAMYRLDPPEENHKWFGRPIFLPSLEDIEKIVENLL